MPATRRLSHGRDCLYVLTVICGVAFATGTVRADDPPECDPTSYLSAPWIVVNGGYYADAGEPLGGPNGGIRFLKPYLTSVVTSGGDLIYVVPTIQGSQMLRFSASKHWEVWSSDGWTQDPDAIAIPIDRSFMRYGRLRLYPHPLNPTASSAWVIVSPRVPACPSIITGFKHNWFSMELRSVNGLAERTTIPFTRMSLPVFGIGRTEISRTTPQRKQVSLPRLLDTASRVIRRN